MKKKNPYNLPEDIFDFEVSAGATEFTGMIPFAPKNDYEIESYIDIMDYMPEKKRKNN